jgi:two-component sensor histidine kinase
MALALKQGEPIRGAEAVAERPDGSRIVFEPYPTPLHDGAGRAIGAVNMLVDITQRKATEQQLRLLASEVDHRAKNMLAVIQAVVNLTQADSISEFKLAVNGRISALARAHTLLSKSRWESADLREIVQEELAPFLNGEDVRVTIDGPNLPVAQPLAHSLAMVVHELTTNAAKHGAMRQPTGKIEIKWWGGLGNRLLFRWTETGCLQVEPPTRQGFGMSIISGAVRQQLAGEVALEWRADGLRCEIDVPL